MTTVQSSKKAFVVKLAAAVIFCAPVGLVWIALSKRLTLTQKIAAGTVALFWFMIGFTPFLASRISETQSERQSGAIGSAVANPTTTPRPAKPKPFKDGAQVVVRKGAKVYGDRELLEKVIEATREKNKADIKTFSEKLASKTGEATSDSVFTVLRKIDERGAFYELEGVTGKGEHQIWCAAADDMESYISPEEAKARAKLATANNKLASDKEEITNIAKECLGEKLGEVQVYRIPSGSHEGQYNVLLHFKEMAIWSEESARRDIEFKMRDVYAKLFVTVPNIWEAWCFAEADMIDKYGKESVDLVYKTSLTNEVAKKVNWKNKDILDFTTLWETHYVHPALIKE